MNSQNSTQRKIFVSTLTILMIVGLAAVAVAQGPGQGRHGRGNGMGDGNFGPEMRIERMANHLDLTEDQVKSIKEIHENGRADNIQLRKQIMQLRNAKRGEMMQDDPSSKTVLELTGKIGDLRTEMQTNRMKSRLEVRKVLTPEQRDKMLLMGEGRGDNQRGKKGSRRGESRGGRQNQCDNSGNGSGRGNGNGNW